ncbi:MAG TPA: saccharopine dehydrogenase NADP-binding domain-containing protein [Thermoanaerobaculia bacterium]|nr:saccharopine dehydrogenase NADP-binding domain-containing protein [Thermoanaerobaculia bacterium]
MKRIVVVGGNGFFGRLITERLRAAGLEPLVASRSSTELRIDANSAEDLRAQLKQRDLVIDAAGPFQTRTPALIEAAAKIGFDVIDINDTPGYAAMVYEHEAPIAAAGIRVLTSCSTLSTVSAAVLGMSSVGHPRRLTAYLRPASRRTANPASVNSFLGSLIGRPRILRFPQPLGSRRGVTVRTADSIMLPRLFPSLREAELIVDAGVPGANAILRAAVNRPQVRRLLDRYRDAAVALVRRIGPRSGILAYEIVTTGGQKHQFFTGEQTHLTAVIPAVMAAQSIAAGRFPHRGVVPPSQHLDAAALFEALWREGIAVVPPWGT